MRFAVLPLLAALSAASLLLSPRPANAADELRKVPLHTRQFEAMGVAFAPLAPAGESVASLPLPARVTIPPMQVRVISAPMAGLLEQFNVAPQQVIGNGSVVAQLSAPGLLEAQRALVQAHSQQRLTDDTARRDEALLADGLIPAARARASQAQALEAQAVRQEREQSLAMLGVARADIDRLLAGAAVAPVLPIQATSGGTVVEVLASPGQRVDAGMPLIKLARLDRLWLELQVPAASADQYRIGDTLLVDDTKVQARLINIGRTVVADSQVVELRAEISGASGLRAGETRSVRVRTRPDARAANRWLVPSAAVVSADSGLQVFVRNPHGITIVPVQKVGEASNGVYVKGALRAGDQVAVKGVAALRSAEATATEGK